MAVTYEYRDGNSQVGTMTCDRECGATFNDGEADITASAFRQRARAAGWKSVRPNPYLQEDVCPQCHAEVTDFEVKARGRQHAAMSMYAENDGRFPDDAPVLVRFPLKDSDPRDDWPWLPGTILGQCPGYNHAPGDEWHVVVDGRGDLAEPDPETPGEWTYPACFRTADEIQLTTEEEWARRSIPAPTTESEDT
jgi:hypothetical protein